MVWYRYGTVISDTKHQGDLPNMVRMRPGRFVWDGTKKSENDGSVILSVLTSDLHG